MQATNLDVDGKSLKELCNSTIIQVLGKDLLKQVYYKKLPKGRFIADKSINLEKYEYLSLAIKCIYNLKFGYP